MFLLSIPASWQTCGVLVFAGLVKGLIFLMMCQPVKVIVDDDGGDGSSHLLFGVPGYT